MSSEHLFQFEIFVQLVNLATSIFILCFSVGIRQRLQVIGLLLLTAISMPVPCASILLGRCDVVYILSGTLWVTYWSLPSKALRMCQSLLQGTFTFLKPTPEIMVSPNSTTCHDILRARKLSVRGKKDMLNRLTGLESRAIPNQRLKHAFDIHNCFVTSHPDVCKRFKDVARLHVQLTHTQWAALRDESRSSLYRLLQDNTSAGDPLVPKTISSLVAKVQVLCLQAAIHVFQDPMGIIDTAFSDDFFYDLSREINHQWIASKDGTFKSQWQWSNQSTLHGLVGHLMSTHKGGSVTSLNTPMNIILPAYETLWRVVLRCFLEVGYRAGRQNCTGDRVLLAFARQPSPGSLKDTTTTSAQISAAHVVKEALRLYPPTRRIYRRFDFGPGHKVDAAADVEAAHRDQATWGADALEFRPSRWQRIPSSHERQHFMAFGSSPFVCVARDSHNEHLAFGPGIIALITGLLLEQLPGESFDLVLEGDEKQEFDQGLPLRNERGDYAAAKLVSKDTWLKLL
ncbi:oxidoreductase-like protein 27 [Elsinoe australis]|uniref:Oxidoreductase-like protein 27 n=1 Tax=Elsinoe australis TaxID=40998 RepID=A0A4U7AUS9_9PEZI|nr:oxidoreductase-like protein 27 [Elsinoe australis]